MQRPVMKSLWDEVFPPEHDSYDSDITDISYPDDPYRPATMEKLEITLELYPYDENDVKGETIHRKIIAHGAYVFNWPPREFIVNQMLKSIDVYPDIIRLDIVTTGSLLRFECDSYEIVNFEPNGADECSDP
ncbi:MAG: hypothetical protein HUJ27_15780 [Rhodobacteraceae bacterium]|nr:hypothetical protein [Paracoccaceae bacterium]